MPTQAMQALFIHRLGRALRLGALAAASLIAATPAQAQCRAVAHAGVSFTVCEFDVRSAQVELFLDDAAGQKLEHFSRVREHVATRGRRLAFAMNAGMYEEDRRPVGLLRIEGREVRRLNTRSARGNFYLKPNGVFFVDGNRAGVMETTAFARARLTPRFATQSGPMLVIDNAIHPVFKPDSENAKLRNGVGVDGTRVAFAISEGVVTFHVFATLFRDVLKTPNALFLDGSISRLFAPGLNRDDFGLAMGPIVGVTLPAGAPAKARP
jgi:uncharacterized protein YigE (DUF2233 family)